MKFPAIELKAEPKSTQLDVDKRKKIQTEHQLFLTINHSFKPKSLMKWYSKRPPPHGLELMIKWFINYLQERMLISQHFLSYPLNAKFLP